MDVEIASHFSMRGLVIGMVALVVLNVMLFTLPEYVGLELTITMMATLGVLIGMYVILITCSCFIWRTCDAHCSIFYWGT